MVARGPRRAAQGEERGVAQASEQASGARGGEASYDIVFDTIFDWLRERANRLAAARDAARRGRRPALERDRGPQEREADAYNLDKRALVLTSLKEVAELAR